jgi:transposase-like protein
LPAGAIFSRINWSEYRLAGHSDQAATKLIWLALRNITANWKRPPIAWQAAKGQLAIQFGERFIFND